MNNHIQKRIGKSRYGEVVRRKLSLVSPIITHNGGKAFFIFLLDDSSRLTQKDRNDLFKILQNSPLHKSGLIINRMRDYPREIEVE